MAHKQNLFGLRRPWSEDRMHDEVCLGTVKVLKPRLVRPPKDDLADRGEWLMTIQVPKYLSTAAVREALFWTFDSTPCGCSRDCCGHPCSTAYRHTLRRVRRGQYQFIFAKRVNY